MTREIPIYQVDAFAAQAFAGNPAAVCPLDDWLPDATLQAIAAENNLSETAFLVKRGQDYDLRWFTPAIEVDLCGHATLASAFVIARHLDRDATHMRFLSRSGPLEVRREGEVFTLDFPAQPPQPLSDSAPFAAALGATPAAVLKHGKGLAVFETEAQVRALAPDMAAVKALDCDGVIASAPGDACDFVSRYFAPHAGIPEDPVTGSAHCVLTPYWAERLGKNPMSARQISTRGGELTVELAGERVRISGRVAPYLEGRIRV